MAKRQLGLGKASEAKRAKKEQENGSGEVEDGAKVDILEAKPDDNEEDFITVPLEEDADPDDALSQLVALWRTWLRSDRENELLLNGVVNECDRILREEKEETKNSSSLFAVFGLALADLAKFHTEDSDVKDYFENALERVDNGLDKYSDSPELKFAKSSIILNRIPLEYISHMDIESKSDEYPDIEALLEIATELYKEAAIGAQKEKKFDIFKELWVVEILESLDDLIEIVRSFGKEHDEEEEDEEEEGEGEGEEEEVITLSKDHPLYEVIRGIDKYGEFFRSQTANYLKTLKKAGIKDETLKLRAARRLGVWYLIEAENAASKYAELTYGGEDDTNTKEAAAAAAAKKLSKVDKKQAETAKTEATKLAKSAVEYLKEAWNEEDPKSWADLAEAQITYGNLYPEGSSQQESLYEKAEKGLKKANNATHGKYKEILEGLSG
ncbi:DEKNAAC104357 [Brettanomyces naardenensis]|uniref:Enhancer of translation termination 1 n=1 Tax=Brettanomyces naardenensis TaxID=13370 RepID=A0A448YQM9_BRENA|nr:DEKNAAC104357 [Brettanomyces naardenensis]